jgi:hypothetical protein
MDAEELVRQIYVMCESDSKSERERMKHYDTAPGDKIANLQYGSTSHGAALQAEKVIRFINSVKQEVEESREAINQGLETKGFKTGIEAAASMIEPLDKEWANFIRSLK